MEISSQHAARCSLDKLEVLLVCLGRLRIVLAVDCWGYTELHVRSGCLPSQREDDEPQPEMHRSTRSREERSRFMLASGQLSLEHSGLR